jgi:hypothetical protein
MPTLDDLTLPPLFLIILATFLAVSLIVIWVRAISGRYGNMSTSEANTFSSETTASKNDALAQGLIAWPSKAMKIFCAVGAYTSALCVVWSICSNVSAIHQTFATFYYSDFIIAHSAEILLTVISIFWIAVAMSSSFSSFLWYLTIFGLLLSIMLALVLNQDRATFWLAFGVLIVIGLQDVYDQFRARTVLKGGAQVLLVLLLWLTLLHSLAEYFLALPPDLFAVVIGLATKVRLVLLTLFGSIVILATIFSVLPKFSWPYREFLPEVHASGWRSIFVQPVFLTINALLNFLLNTSNVFIEAIVDAFRFVRDVFFDRDLWKTVFNVGFIALWSFTIPYLIALSKPHLTRVLRTPSILNPFGTDRGPDLIWSTS